VNPDWTLLDLSFYRVAIMDAVSCSGLKEHLEHGVTVDELQNAGYQAAIVRPILRLLEIWGWVHSSDSDQWIWCSSQADLLSVLTARQARRWLDLSLALGNPLASTPNVVGSEQGILGKRSRALISWLLTLVGDVQGQQWLDIGAGPGLWASQLALGGAEVTLMDLPDVTVLWDLGTFHPGMRIYPGDVFKTFPDNLFDRIALIRFIENFSPVEVEKLFRVAYDHLAPQGALLIAGYWADDTVEAQLFSLQVAIHQTRGRCYALHDIIQLAKSAQLRPSQTASDPASGYGAVFLTKANVAYPPPNGGQKS